MGMTDHVVWHSRPALRRPVLIAAFQGWNDAADGASTALRTLFSGGAVRWPTVAVKTADIAFEYGPDLWLLKGGTKTATKLKFVVSADEKQTTRRREKLTSGVTEVELSPDGKTLAFGLRGDIWTVAMEKSKGVAGRSEEFARRLTDWVGDDLYHQEMRITASTAKKDYEITGSVLNLIPLRNRRTDPEGQQLVTRISEGMTRWEMKGGEHEGKQGWGMSEYLDQIIDGQPVGKAE